MNFSWNQVPLVRLVIPLIIGILSVMLFHLNCPEIVLYAVLVTFILSCILQFSGFSKSFRFRYVFGITANLICFFLGIQLVFQHQEYRSSTHFSDLKFKDSQIIAAIDMEPQEKKNSVRSILKVIYLNEAGTLKRSEGRLLVYFNKDSSSLDLHYGSVILFEGEKISQIAEPFNPGEFDQRSYLEKKSVYHSVYLQNRKWKLTSANSGNPVLAFAIQFRKKLLNVFSSNGLAGEEFAVLSALILGYTDDIDQELNAAYASAGAMHILSVSGMHVGIIYIVLNWFLGFLGKKKSAAYSRMIILLIFLWFYATLTGLSPAVLRSAMMLSFVVIGDALNKMTNIYNTLASSVLVLLVFNPYLIADVGFQLSYLAVFGIVAVHPFIYDLYEPKSKIKDSIWSLISVSIAAQFTTLPLSFYYFHQFPVYFLFSNLIVIPLSTIIIYGGIALLFISPVHAVSYYVGWIMNSLVWLLNSIIKLVQHLPFALLKGVFLSPVETGTAYVIFIALFLFLLQKRKVFLLILCSSLFLFSSFRSVDVFSRLHQRKLAVYSIKGYTAIDFISGNEHILLCDSLLIQNENNIAFHLANFYGANNLVPEGAISINEYVHQEHDTIKVVPGLSHEKNFVFFFDKKILFLDSLFILPGKRSAMKTELDYVIVSRQTKIKLKDLLTYFFVKKIIIDSSVSQKKQKKWEEECRKYNMAYYSVVNRGAYIAELSKTNLSD